MRSTKVLIYCIFHLSTTSRGNLVTILDCRGNAGRERGAGTSSVVVGAFVKAACHASVCMQKNTRGEKSKKLTSNASKCFFNCGNYRQTRAATAATTTTNAGKLLLFMPVCELINFASAKNTSCVAFVMSPVRTVSVLRLARIAKSLDDFVLFKRANSATWRQQC